MFDGTFKSTRKVNLSGRKKTTFAYGASGAAAVAPGVAQASSKEELLQQSKLLREERVALRKKTTAATKIQAEYCRVATARRVRSRVFCEVEAELTATLTKVDIRSQPLPTPVLQGFLRKFLVAYGKRASGSSAFRFARDVTEARLRNVQDYLVFTLLVSALRGTKQDNTNILAASGDATWRYQIAHMLEIALRVAVETKFANLTEQAANPYVLLLDTFVTADRYAAAGVIDSRTVVDGVIRRLALAEDYSSFEALRRLMQQEAIDRTNRVASIVGRMVMRALASLETNDLGYVQLLQRFARKILLTPNVTVSPLLASLVGIDTPSSFWTSVIESMVPGTAQAPLTWSEAAIATANVLGLISHNGFVPSVVEAGVALLTRIITRSHIEWAYDTDSSTSLSGTGEDVDMEDEDDEFAEATTQGQQLLATLSVSEAERRELEPGVRQLGTASATVKAQWQQLHDTSFVRRAFAAAHSHQALQDVCSVYATFLLGFSRGHLVTVRQSIKPLPTALFSFLSAASIEVVSIGTPSSPSASIVQRMWAGVKASNAGSAISSADSLLVFTAVYSHMLLSLDDETFYDRSCPFSVQEVREIVGFLKQFIYDACWNVRSSSSTLSENTTTPDNQRSMFPVVTTAVKLFNQLYDRDCRRRFTDDGEWLWPAMPVIKETVDLESMEGNLFELHALSSLMAPTTSLLPHVRASFILTTIPQVFSFTDRVQLFEKLLEDEKQNMMHVRDEFSRAINVRIKRDEIVDESIEFFDKVCGLKSPALLKSRIKVTFINEQGLEEAGIDGGGVFKEYIDQLTKSAFSSDYNFFLSTSEHLLYPNPAARLLVDSHKQVVERFRFLGQVLGKAVYESILVEPQFAAFFLNKLLGKFNYIDDLYSLDPELYRHLMQLKHYQGNVEDLALTFSVSESEFGQVVTRDLVPNGASIPVTNENRIRYVHLLANYKLNIQCSHESAAFLRGFRDLIPAKWIQMFSPSELQTLIGGSANKIDVQDWQRHTVYGGGYHPSQRPIQWFWDLVENEFTSEDRAALLKFITSVSRQPLLGFSQLAPQICIHQVRIDDDERLPSSATCMNLLKLPTYSSKDIMKRKLLYAIRANAGFDLS